MTNPNALTLVNPQNGNLAFKIFSFEDNSPFDHIQRLNYYSMILITEGEAAVKVDFSNHIINNKGILFFAPYQPFMISQVKTIKGIAINFHPDFFCIHKHQKEVSCNGVLFNNIYDPPFITVSEEDTKKFVTIIDQMKEEMQSLLLARYELLLSYLKIFLINASRLKVTQNELVADAVKDNKEPFVLQRLKEVIEEHYKEKHLPSDYALLLNISPKALAKLTKTHFNKTLTFLIAERIVIEAKRELYLTAKPVKQIAYELGFDDEYYFSRFFKKNADIPPQIYRETVGFNKADS